MRGERDTYESMQSELAALRAELAAYRSVVVPRSEYDRAIEARDHALAQLDSIARQLADRTDARSTRRADSALAHLAAVMRTLAKETGGREDEQIRNAARAFLVEQGFEAPELRVMREAWDQREARTR